MTANQGAPGPTRTYGGAMDRIAKEDFQADAASLLMRVEEGESFIIEHNEVPVAELRPYGGAVSGP